MKKLLLFGTTTFGIITCIAFAIILIALACCTIIFTPLLTIWAINTLFGTMIKYTFYSWCASTWMMILLCGARGYRLPADTKPEKK